MNTRYLGGALIEQDPAVIAFAREQAGNDDIIRAYGFVTRCATKSSTILICRWAGKVIRRRWRWSAPAVGACQGALLTACCRAAGIPARPGYADVVNHLATEKLIVTWQRYFRLAFYAEFGSMAPG